MLRRMIVFMSMCLRFCSIYTCTPLASVTYSRVLLPSLIRPFPIKIGQKSDQDPVICGGKLKLYYLITTTIRYCYGRVLIQPLPAEFVPILQFSIRFWSDLYLTHGKKLPNLFWQRPDSHSNLWSDRDQTVTRQWTARSGRNLDSIGKKPHWKISPDYVRSSRQHRTLLQFWSDTAESVAT
jgi:hypothetical protein